ncbi:hypothetical protein [Catenuloplanes atrovinosus]|uniref:Leucine rich repeat variant n=1 Tax=Catenuloplanes atrovinosus TaxID=137266 RepID=A0AAE3YQ84_9ACTN|nr:hypothetical protein [Catenuloplanes atrovinosus]MDR7276640.1 hypothetical protein [Catenuloplanes atrovinosus]
MTSWNPYLDDPALLPDGEAAPVHGLAVNPAAPVELLLRMLDRRPDAMAVALRHRPDLPHPVAEAAARHPDEATRRALAGNPDLTPGIRSVLAHDPIMAIAECAAGRAASPPWPEAARTLAVRQIERMLSLFRRARMEEHELLDEIARELPYRNEAVPAVAAEHPDPLIRRAAALVVPIDGPHWRRLTADEDERVRSEIERRAGDRARRRDHVYTMDDLRVRMNGYAYRALMAECRLAPELIAYTLETGVASGGAEAVAGNPHLTPDAVEAVAGHPAPEVRAAAARRPDLTRAQLDRLAADPDASVRTRVSLHPALTEPERAAIDIDVSTMPRSFPSAPCEDVADSVRMAASVNPLLRRRAAIDPRLPAGPVAALAEDADPVVRDLLARHHPDAPPAVLLDAFRRNRHRRELTRHRNFPTTGLAPLAADADPQLRIVALRDPRLDPATLLDDRDPTVRRAAAACPRLPAARIVALLEQPGLCAAAASNEALPVPSMWKVLS